MKAKFNEHDYTFSIELECESQEDAAWLTRWKLNSKVAPVYLNASVRRDGKFTGYCTWSKRGDYTSEIKR